MWAGGKALIKMVELKAALEDDGFAEVRTYIASGNVFFSADNSDKAKLAEQLVALMKRHFAVETSIALFTKAEWQAVIQIGRTSVTKIISTPAYKQLTIRNYNTAQKLLALFD